MNINYYEPKQNSSRSSRASVFLTDEFKANLQISVFSGLSSAIIATGNRYFSLMTEYKPLVAKMFTEAELKFLLSSCFPVKFGSLPLKNAVLNVLNKIPSAKFVIEKVERKPIEVKVANLTLIEQYALVGLIEETQANLNSV